MLAPLSANVELDTILQDARAFAAAARASNTRRTYAAQWRGFVAWCAAVGLRPLPAAPETVALYITALAREGLFPASIDVALAALAKQHEAHALGSPCASPTVAAVRAGLRRTIGVAPRQAAPLRAVVTAIGADLLGRAALHPCGPRRERPRAGDDGLRGRGGPPRRAVDAFATQGAAIKALVEAGLSLDDARRRTIEIVRAEFPWSVIEPHARALAGGEVPGDGA